MTNWLPEAHAKRFITAARRLFLGRVAGETGPGSRPVMIAGGQPLTDSDLTAFRHSCEKHALDLVYFEFRIDRPEVGPTNVVVIAEFHGLVVAHPTCDPWLPPSGPMFVINRRTNMSFHFDGRGLVIAPSRVSNRSQGSDRARTTMRKVASTVSPGDFEKIPSLADFADAPDIHRQRTRH